MQQTSRGYADGDEAGDEAAPGRGFWRDVLAAGGFTRAPRWVADSVPRPGTGTLDAVVAPKTAAGLRRAAQEAGVSLDAILLAGHGKVIGALAGETDVVTGLATGADGEILPCPLSLDGGTWRDLALDAQRSLRLVRRYTRFRLPPQPGEAAPAEIQVALPSRPARPAGFTRFTRSTGEAGEAGEAVLRISFEDQAGELRVRLDHRLRELDEEAAARTMGYHLAAFDVMAAGLDAEHRRQSLLTHQEIRLQLEGLAGPVRQRPEQRFHELFEERVQRHPNAVAAVHGARRWTYRELDRHANRIAHALLARGLGHEDVVAVVTERSLEWMAAVIGVFKAGGVYLPVEPHFPADRIAVMLTRSGCRYALTDPAGAQRIEAALLLAPGVVPLSLEATAAGDFPDNSPGVPVGPGQLAYVYFTSGSTGEPKGAMCEHAGMLNHLYAKIEDLGMTEGSVVAQTAPQCFDISLWQLVSALLVGGRTLIVEQQAVLDVGQFIDTVIAGEVEFAQVVPSYLDVVLAALREEPRAFPRLRCVSVTGEAVKKELVQRWFAALPDVGLVNAYGLTETSDDTNHEVMRRVPEQGRVPLGRPIANVSAYVVDPFLSPVPLGAPGEIVFSGVCVGRGYINDEERTRSAFLEDPHRGGCRLYRSGDFGRWLPGGKLEFLCRRDDQVKIRGFRIEVGEIENQLLRVAGVRDAAVVVAGRPDGSRHLVAFYSAAAELPREKLSGLLGEALPSYMVPDAFHWRAELPLTGNGKTDKKTLTRIAADLAPASGTGTPPGTPAELRLAAAWAEVLGVPVERITRFDDFFELGGTSLSAVRLVIALERLISPGDVTRTPVLADLARLLGAAGPPDDGAPRAMAPAGAAADSADLAGLVLQPSRVPTVVADACVPAAEWAAEQRADLHAAVARHGAVLIRGLDLRTPEDAGLVLDRLRHEGMTEREAVAPRQQYADGVRSVSVWPADQPMCMHHELGYRLEVPALVLFACLTPGSAGGATGIADSAAVLRALPADIVARFEREGWILQRTYGEDLGLRWEEAFGIEGLLPAQAEQYCRQNGLDFSWRGDRRLSTTQRRAAVLRHPITGERGWFNQAAFLSEWTMAPEVREYLRDVYGADGLPFQTFHGNGEPIGEDVVELIAKAYEENTVRHQWETGDVLLVDNLRMAHSREPYQGPRRICAALGNPVTLPGPPALVPGA